MFLSYLLIDVGENPDRPRPGRLWLRNLYRVHQRLCMAFPSDSRKATDLEFLHPYRPSDFAQGHVHVKRTHADGFLFRVDPQSRGRAVIVIQSAIRPDWDYAFGLRPGVTDGRKRPIGNASYLLAAPPSGPQPFDADVGKGTQFRFRLRANPTKKVGSLSRAERVRGVMARDDNKKNGARIALLREEDQIAWLLHKGEEGGFRIPGQWADLPDGRRAPNFRVQVVPEGWVRCGKNGHTDGRFFAVRFDGLLEVTDPVQFLETLRAGIGSAKGFGFGLLSLARPEAWHAHTP